MRVVNIPRTATILAFGVLFGLIFHPAMTVALLIAAAKAGVGLPPEFVSQVGDTHEWLKDAMLIVLTYYFVKQAAQAPEGVTRTDAPAPSTTTTTTEPT